MTNTPTTADDPGLAERLSSLGESQLASGNILGACNIAAAGAIHAEQLLAAAIALAGGVLHLAKDAIPKAGSFEIVESDASTESEKVVRLTIQPIGAG